MTSTPLFTAHDVPDLIALLPTRLGFVPRESLCAIATSGPRHRFGFSMRIDVPESVEAVPALARHVCAHLARQGAEGAIVVAVSERPEIAGPLVWAVEDSLGPVLPVVSGWATKDRYWTTFDDCDPAGNPYEIPDHHLAVVQAVAAGQEILPDREALERRYQPEQSERRRWMTCAVDSVALDVARRIGIDGGDPETLGRRELGPILQAALLGRAPDEGEVLRVVVWMTSLPVRDVAWGLINRETARDFLTFWAHAARLAPPGFEAGPLCLAGFSAYLCGDGAQALIALQRASALDPDYSLAGLLLEALTQGVPPDRLESVTRPLAEDDPGEVAMP